MFSRWPLAALLLFSLFLNPSGAFAINRIETLYERSEDIARKAGPRFSYVFRFYSSAGGTDASGAEIKNFGMMGHEATGGVALIKGGGNLAAFAPRVGYLRVKTDAKVPGTTTTVPPELYKAAAGIQIVREQPGSSTIGLYVEPGSMSDRVFSSDSFSIDATLFYRAWRGRAPGDLSLFVDYSNNRPFLNGLPLPGFGYMFTAAPGVFVMAGFPVLAINARLGNDWVGRARFFPTQSAFAELTYALSAQEGLVAAIKWDFESYLRHGRAVSANRLIFSEKSATLDLVARVIPQMTVRAGGGLAFDRSILEAKNFYDTSGGQVLLKPTVMATVRMNLEF